MLTSNNRVYLGIFVLNLTLLTLGFFTIDNINFVSYLSVAFLISYPIFYFLFVILTFRIISSTKNRKINIGFLIVGILLLNIALMSFSWLVNYTDFQAFNKNSIYYTFSYISNTFPLLYGFLPIEYVFIVFTKRKFNSGVLIHEGSEKIANPIWKNVVYIFLSILLIYSISQIFALATIWLPK